MTPYEEIELMADNLPLEGETIVVSRKDGELLFEPLAEKQAQNGISDVALYGRLVQANEQLASLLSLPLWLCALAGIWVCAVLHGHLGFKWRDALWDVAVMFTMLALFFIWTRILLRRRFRKQVAPMIENELRRLRLDRFTFIAAVSQHPELRYLMDELGSWHSSRSGSRKTPPPR